MDGWNITVAGAALCCLYGWSLSFLRRSDGEKVGKSGPLIGLAGAAVLTAMAVVNPGHVVSTDFAELPANVSRATAEPASNSETGNVVFRQANGTLDRVTTRKYAQLENLTLTQVASEVGVHPSTVVRWISTGKVNVPKRKNRQGHYRFSQKDLSLLRKYSERIEEVKH